MRIKNGFRQLMMVAAICALAIPVQAKDIPTTQAKRVGFSAERLDRITELTQRYVDAGQIAGAITMVSRHGKLVHYEAVGNRGIDKADPLQKDDLFRIYSMSKPITAVAIMQLYEQGKFQLTDPISKFVPELAELSVLGEDGELTPANKPITMQHLLTHTAGFSYGFDPKDPVDQLYRDAAAFGAKNLDEFTAALAKLPLKYQPGSQWHYSVAVDVTGLIVERLSGQPFDEYLQQHIFAPLGMVDTFFSVPDDKLERFLPNHGWNPEENKLVTLGPDSVSPFRNATMFSGGGGLVSTATDYLRFSEMLRAGGELDGKRIIGRNTLKYMTINHLPASVSGGGTGESPNLVGAQLRGFGFGLGFGLMTDTAAAGVIGSNGEFYWGGAAGTIFWVDPEEDMVVIAMIQLMGSPWPLRSDLKAAVHQAIIGR
jgi:CubicO group peptidase (beta-lactamase class C family)